MSRSSASSSSGVISFTAASSKHDFLPVAGDLPSGGLDAAALARTVDQDRIGVVDVDVNAPFAKARKRRKRAVRAVDGHVPHAAAGLRAGAGGDHLVIGEQRAVEQHDVGA